MPHCGDGLGAASAAAEVAAEATAAAVAEVAAAGSGDDADGDGGDAARWPESHGAVPDPGQASRSRAWLHCSWSSVWSS